MAGDIQVRFNDFKGGDWGNRDPSMVDRDQWSGENMMVYRSGLLGTRAELRQLAITGLPNYADADSPRGFAASGTKLLLVVNRRIYTIPQGDGAADAFYPDLPAGPLLASDKIRLIVGNGVLYSLVTTNGILRKHPFLPGVTTTVTTPAPFGGITRWGLWMVAFPHEATPNPQRIYFNLVDASGPNYDSWPANNFYDISNTDPVLSLRAIFNTLYVGKREGWWAVTGVLGDLASVRDVAVGRGPSDDQRVAVGPDSRIVYWSAAVTEFDLHRVPSFFNGADPVATDESQPVEFDEGFASFPFSRGDMVAVPATGDRVMLAYTTARGTSSILMREGRRWTRHRFPIEFGAVAPNEIREGSQMKPGVMYMAQLRQAAEAPVVTEWRHDTDKPGDADMTTVAASPRVSGTVSLPAHWEPNGRQLLVKRVIVQFKRWSSAVADTDNVLTVRVDALGQYGGGNVSSMPQTWTQPAAESTDTGVDDSVRFDFGDQGYGNGFQIVFEAIAGVAIREVICEVEVQRDR